MIHPPEQFEPFTVRRSIFQDCLSSIWGSQSPSACEKELPILELLWEMPATLNVALP